MGIEGKQPDRVIDGRFEPADARRYRHVPFDVPAGVEQLHIRCSYGHRVSSDPAMAVGNTLDLGLFDERGTESGGPGFRGWSGSEHLSITIGRDWATPPYRAGAIGAGTWTLLLGPYKVAPRGLDYRVEIWFDAGVAPAPPDERPVLPVVASRRVAAAEAGWVRGDLHCHSTNSDGDASPLEVLHRAREVGLDFLALTDHNAASFPAIPAAGGSLPLLIPGIEVTTYLGHWNVWGVREWFDFRGLSNDAVAAEMARAKAAGGFVSINHPRPLGPDWEFDPIDINDGIEVWNGPWERLNAVSVLFWEDRLDAGHRPVAVGGSDMHELKSAGDGMLPPPKLGEPTTWVYTGGELSVGAVLDGLRAGRCFISATPNGPQVYSSVEEGIVRVRVVGGNGATLNAVANEEPLESRSIDTDDATFTFELPAGRRYIRFEVSDGGYQMLAFGNPLWLD